MSDNVFIEKKRLLENRSSIILFIIMCLGHFIVDLSLGLWPLWKTISQYPVIESGVIAALSVFIGESTQAIFSIWSDRGYWKPIVAFGFIIAASTLFLPLSHSLITAGFLFFCTCLGSSAFHPTAAGLVASLSFGNKAILIAIFHTSGLLGLAISQIFFTSLYNRHPFAPIFFILVPILLAVILFFLQRKKSREYHHHEKVQLRVFLEFLQRGDLRRVYFLLFCNQTMIWSLLFLLPDFLLEKGASLDFSYGGGHCIFILGAAFTCIPLGVLASRLHIPLIIFGAYILSIISCVLTLFSPSSHLILGSTLFLLGGSMGSIAPLALAMGNELEPNRRSTVSAFLMGFVWIFSEGLGYSLSAYLTSFFTHNPAISALGIMGTILLFGAFQAFSLLKYISRKSS